MVRRIVTMSRSIVPGSKAVPETFLQIDKLSVFVVMYLHGKVSIL